MDEIVKAFSRNFASKTQTSELRKIGLELELPMVTGSGEAVSYHTVREMFHWLEKKGWETTVDGGTGEVVEARKSITRSKGRFGYDKDMVATEMGYCTVELSMCPEDDLNLMETHWKTIKKIILEYLRPLDCHLLGYGVQPITYPSSGLIANKGRYKLFEQESLNRIIDQKYGQDVSVFATSASNQCHVDIYKEEAIEAVNTMNGLAPLLSAVTANAPVWRGSVDAEWLDVREIFWDKCQSGRVEQTGIPGDFNDFNDYVDRLCQFRPLMVKRGNEYIKILGHDTFGEFIRSRKRTEGNTVNGKSVTLVAEPDDILFQSGFAWWAARLAPSHGTLEVRSCSQQPENAMLSVAAFTLGLIENLQEASALYDQYSLADWRKLRFDVLRHGLSATLEGQSVVPLVKAALRISRQGLSKRGLGEEKFLNVLDQRVAEGLTVADKVKVIFDKNNLQPFFNLVEIR